MRTDVLELMVDAAKKLLVLVSMPDFPFHLYSSSLLLAYEGDPGAPLRAELRMIDFAHTHVVGEGEEVRVIIYKLVRWSMLTAYNTAR